ncbi:hypothetical protein PHMEG_00025686 [Phytophthora megakarya]|uniref:HAT C-terminal dimerisation domain-containing protein n=1 Tax=Phytophthora megakarya TaxID=4795 RepID=A0A225VE07_9STRA|nr:hypothetical protein PHMEG_00025686 [Phytophthora megakarya]
MEDWSLMREYCTRMLSDSGANVVKAARLLQLEHMPCIAHTLHLIVGGAMIKAKSKTNPTEMSWLDNVNAESDVPILEHEEDEQLSNNDREGMESLREFAINDINSYLDSTISSLQRSEMDAVRVIVQHFRTLAVYFRKSPKARNRLNCPTRWSSCWLMLQRLLHLQDALASFFSHLHTFEGQQEFKDMKSKLRKPKTTDWLAINCLTTLLSPFSTAIKALGGGQKYPTVTLVLPVLSGMRRWLSRENLFEPHKAAAGAEDDVDSTILMMNECRDSMLDLFNLRFSELEKSDLAWITLLDPCMVKQMPHLTTATIPRACEDLVRAAIAMAAEEHNTPFNRRSHVGDTNNAVVFDLHGFLYGSQGSEAPQTDWIQLTEELRMYLADAKRSATDRTSPFDWWRTRKTVYPNLSMLARKWLGVVATSVPSERAFSTSGNVVSVKRASLTPRMVRDIVFVSENWHRYAEKEDTRDY